MEYKEFKELVIKAASELGLEDYELYYSSSESVDLGTFKHEINEFSASQDGGVCFRCIVDSKMGYASTEALSEAEAISLVNRAAENAKTIESDEKQFLVEGGQEYTPVKDRSYPLPDTSELVDTALKIDEKLYAADKMTADGSQGGAGTSKFTVAITNSRGLDLSYSSSAAYYAAASVVTDGNEMNDDFKAVYGSFDGADIDKTVKETVERAKSMLGAGTAPTGNYPVVFSPDAMMGMLSVFSDIFNSENAQKGLSRLLGREGEKIAADIVTLTDDPFYEGNGINRSFDGEGSPTYTKNVIENGVLKTLLYNLKTANIAGMKTTGNAAKSGYSSGIGIRPFTFYIRPGDMSEEDLLKKAGDGVYITDLGGLHAGANAISGDFSLQSSGYMIEGGRKTRPVKSFTVSGNFYELLKNITALSDKVTLPRPYGVTSFGSPSVLVEGLTVAGK